ncbi:gluzincin family metallopeptidase [Urbifossiella limnaea]|uniref:Peptidase S8 n=1 Tax=Urbifossiella limnaea TaxID=2528023 RepID=A0A517Y0J7_9BACT|nr:hypothetical protein [Urbifossiella limnaea]QDU23286.1 hypothetical protein ETAA1_52800 [Urbifossiella limnaea]
MARSRPRKPRPKPVPPLPPPDVAPPSRRRLQVYALDPAADQSLSTANIARCVLPVRWEALTPGPVGEYVEVVDVDPSSGCAYDPVDLDHPHHAAQDGLRPSEGNPHFHQQMVYAVVMKTIENFEAALGRPVMWADRPWTDKHPTGRELTRAERYVPRLRVYPHALREANAYYSPSKKALLFGYFNAQTADPREELPGGMVFTCLSHDVIAHETTHAILDGIHPRLLKPSNGDMLAFHEGFADIVAIFQHFTLPGLLLDQMHKTRGDLSLNNLLAELAGQFGRATKRGGALRNALGEFDKDGRRVRPQPKTLAGTTKPHDRGAVLVAAVFDAFLRIYEDRIRDLKRIASDGSGILRPGDIHPDLARRFADEAIKAAQRVLNISVRALDYLPPVDITFGDYLRALITADAELVPDDPKRHRVAFIEAFRERGILPDDVRSLGEDSLRWQPATRECVAAIKDFMPPPEVIRTMLAGYDSISESIPEAAARKEWTQFDTRVALREAFLRKMWVEPPAQRDRRVERRMEAYKLENTIAAFLHQWLRLSVSEPAGAAASAAAARSPASAAAAAVAAGSAAASSASDAAGVIGEWLGLDLHANNEYLARPRGERRRPGDMPIEVHDVRPTYRVRADGRTKVELVVVLTQKRRWLLPATDAGKPEKDEFAVGQLGCQVARDDWRDGTYAQYQDDAGRKVYFTFRGGCTLIINPETGELRYAIAKNVLGVARRNANARFFLERLIEGGPAVMDRYGLEYEGAKDDTDESGTDAPARRRRANKRRPLEPFALTHRGTDEEGD